MTADQVDQNLEKAEKLLTGVKFGDFIDERLWNEAILPPKVKVKQNEDKAMSIISESDDMNSSVSIKDDVMSQTREKFEKKGGALEMQDVTGPAEKSYTIAIEDDWLDDELLQGLDYKESLPKATKRAKIVLPE